MNDMVTVVMATMNSDRYIFEALSSVANQSAGRIRTIVVDRASSDRTLELAANFSFVEVVRQSTEGYHQAWSQGIELTSTPYVCLLDSDDVYSEDGVACGVSILESTPLVDASLGRVEFFGEMTDQSFRIRQSSRELVEYPPIPGCFMFRRSVFQKFGLFESELAVMGDMAWYLNARRLGLQIVKHDNVVLRKRVHQGSLGARSVTTVQYAKEMLEIARRFNRHKGAQVDGPSAFGGR